MTTPTTTTNTESVYQPNSSQLAREIALKRFNWIFVFVPVTLLGLIVLGLVIYLIWAALASSPEDHLFSLLSGTADIILITCVIMPAMLMCAVGPALAGFLIYRSTERRKLPPEERRSKLQILLWRIDSLIEKIQARLHDSYLDKAAHPIIKGHAITAALRTITGTILRLLGRRKG